MGGVGAQVFFLDGNGEVNLLKWADELNAAVDEVLDWSDESRWLRGEEDTWEELVGDHYCLVSLLDDRAW